MRENASITFKRTPDKRWAVLVDGERVGTAYDNGARKSYHRNWTAVTPAPERAESRHSSRQSAAEHLARKAGKA